MRRGVSVAGVLALVVLLLALPCFLGTANGQMAGVVYGTVLDRDGKPVEGARVVCRFEGGLEREPETRTDAKGVYTQIGLQPGPYTVSVEKEGLGKRSAKVTLRVGGRLTVNFQFVPEGAKATPAVAKAFQEATAASEAGRNEEAIAKFEQVVAIDPLCYPCQQGIGLAYMKMKQYERAEAALRKAIGLEPANPAAHDGLAAVYNAQRRFDDAAKASEAAAKLRGNAGGGSASATLDQGLIFWNAGKIDEAKAKFEETLRLDPNHAEVHYWLGMANLNQGRTSEAAAEMEVYLNKEPSGRFARQAKELLAQIKK